MFTSIDRSNGIDRSLVIALSDWQIPNVALNFIYTVYIHTYFLHMSFTRSDDNVSADSGHVVDLQAQTQRTIMQKMLQTI